MDVGTARRALEAEQQRLTHTFDQLVERIAADMGNQTNDPSAIGWAPAEAGSALLEGEMELSVLGRLERDRREVAAALDRVDAGTYGRCQTCGSAIADDRLQAVPATRYCREHEVEAEVPLEDVDEPGKGTIPSALDLALRMARQNLDLVPDDDVVDEPDQNAEDLAVHVVDPVD